MKKPALSLTILLIAALLLSACGGDDDAPDVELSRRVSLVEGFVRLQLPETWVAEDDGRTVLFANNQDTLTQVAGGMQSLVENIDRLPPNSQVGLLILNEVVLGNSGYTPGNLLDDQFRVDGSLFPPGVVQETRINGRNAALAPIEFADVSLGGMLAVVDMQGVVVTLIGVWSADGDGNIAATFEAILAQMELDVGGLTRE